jgi:cytochrome c-type biogenesis protein CcmH
MATLKRVLVIALGVMALLVGARAAQAQGATPPPGTPLSGAQAAPTDNDVNRVARQMYCPVCENIPLDVCPTTACAKWRETIREKLAAGWTDQQIMDYFVTQYGERVLANPSARGFNIFLWVIPPVVLAAGVVFLWFFFRRAARQAKVAAPAAPPAPTDKYVAELEKELEKRR